MKKRGVNKGEGTRERVQGEGTRRENKGREQGEGTTGGRGRGRKIGGKRVGGR